jgi:glycosyltransferase involved in cell wall biosynthesis
MANTGKSKRYDLSIVVPIYNGENYINAKFASLFKIKGIDYEVIFVVNKSSDKSQELIDTLSKNQHNISVIIQQAFVSGGQNFQTGVREAKGDYIFVSAVDDICERDFYAEALEILRTCSKASAVAPKTVFDNSVINQAPISFELVGSRESRISSLIQNIRVSHSIFYSMLRKEFAKGLYENFEKDFDFVAGDWLFNLKLALSGEVHRTRSICTYGGKGLSKSGDALWKPGDGWVKRVFPYRTLIYQVFLLARHEKRKTKLILWKFCFTLAKGNLHRYVNYVKRNLDSIANQRAL